MWRCDVYCKPCVESADDSYFHYAPYRVGEIRHLKHGFQFVHDDSANNQCQYGNGNEDESQQEHDGISETEPCRV